MPIYMLPEAIVFPHPRFASKEGIVAIGGDLKVERLLLAYQFGIFPWYNPEEEIIWWSPDPRYVIFPDEVRVTKSMRPYFNSKKFDLTYDKDFRSVIRACKETKRKGQPGTWISDEMEEAYIELHEMGYAHSVEVWDKGQLAGGLYGVSLGKCFFGESMFSKKSNASKFGFISLAKKLKDKGFWLIDCQLPNDHVKSLGAKPIPRSAFLDYLRKNILEETWKGSWSISDTDM